MSLTSLPIKIFGILTSSVAKLPGVKNVFLWINSLIKMPAKTDSKNTSSRSEINEFSLSKVDDKDMTFNLAPKIKAQIKEVEAVAPNINNGISEFKRITNKHIVAETLEGVQKIKFNEGKAGHSPLVHESLDFIEERKNEYIRQLEDLNNKNQNYSNNHIIDFEEYYKVFDNYFTESLTLIANLNNQIFHRITSSDKIIASDLDIAEGFCLARTATTALCNKFLKDFQTMLPILNRLPADAQNDISEFTNSLKSEFRTVIKTLFHASKVGILDREFVETFKQQYIEKAEKQPLNAIDTTVLKEFQRGTHGSLLLKSGLEGTEIASLDIKITQKVIKDLNKLIIELSQIKNQNQQDQEKISAIRLKIADLTNYLASTAKQERRINESLESFLKDPLAIQLEIPREEVTEIFEIYNEINQINNYIGNSKDDMVAGERYPQEALINSLGNNFKSNEFSKKYERLVLETSLVASYHALSEHMDGLSNEQREKYFEDKVKFANFNKENVPWLKGLYNSELKKYRNIIANDKSKRKSADIAVQMCNLCQRLASKEIDVYNSNDFFTRYNLIEIVEKAIARVGTMTDINNSSLALKVYSEIFSNLEKDPEAAKLSKPEAKWLSRHVEFLKDLFTIKDRSGKVIYAPEDGNPYEQAKYDEIEAYFHKTPLVNYNIDLILRYFKNAITEKRNVLRKSDKYSDLESRNLLLSSALMYYYLKFMPEKSNNLESLRNREKVIQSFFDTQVKVSVNLPKELGPKILDQFFGTESDEKGNPISEAKYERKGFLRSYALELQEKLSRYIHGHEYKRIDLQSLLHFYYRLEQIKKNSLDREHKIHPGNAGKDIADINKNRLELWSQQEKWHIKFHNGRNIELLPPLEQQLKALLNKHSSDVMKFIANIPDKEVKKHMSKEIAKELFKQASSTIQNITDQQTTNILEINDNNKNLLENVINALGNLSRVSNLLYKGNQIRFNVTENSILGEDDKVEFENNLKIVESFLESPVLLVDAENKTGENVRDLKNITLNLLKNFKIKPAISNHLEWMTEAKVKKYIDNQQIELGKNINASEHISKNSDYRYSSAA